MQTQTAGLKRGDGLGDFMLFTTDARRNAAPADTRAAIPEDREQGGATSLDTGIGGLHTAAVSNSR